MAPIIKLKYAAPTRKPFPWRWFGVGIVSFSIGLIIFLTLLNVILVGFETVPGVRQDYNFQPQNHWWSKNKAIRSLVTQPPDCDPVFFHAGEIFQTNRGMFNYEIFELPPPADPKNLATVSYQANSLSNCTVREVMIRADYVSREAQLIATIYCSWPFESILRTRIMTSDIPILNDFSQSVVKNSNPHEIDTEQSLKVFQTIFLTLNALAQDLFVGWWSAGPATVTYSVLQWCNFDEENSKNIIPPLSECESSPYTLDVERLIRISSDGNNATSLGDVVNTLPPGPITDQSLAALVEPGNNLAQAFIHALHVDLGHYVPNNIFTNATAFSATINPANSITSILTDPNSARKPFQVPRCADSEPCGPGSNITSGSSIILRSLDIYNIPLKNDSTLVGGVIHVNYVCPDFKLKSTKSLLASVFTSTYSMFLTAWTCIMFIAVYFAERDAFFDPIDKREASSADVENQEIARSDGDSPGTLSYKPKSI